MNKCEFCEHYFPSTKDGAMKCNAASYDLKYNNACKDALDRMVKILTVPNTVNKAHEDPRMGDVLDRLFGK